MRARTACIAALLSGLAVTLPASAGAAPVSSHAEVTACCTPHEQKVRLFEESKALGASYIRVAVEVSGIFGGPDSSPKWSGLDDVIALSRRYGIRVLGILIRTPTWLSTCPTGPDPSDCPPKDYGKFGSLVGQIAAHARGSIHHWQILNEPSLSWAFKGTAADYGHVLSASSAAIKRVAPEDLVVLGNQYVTAAEQAWLGRALSAGGSGRYDVAAINLRSFMKHMTDSIKVWRRFLAKRGFRGPLWVTEHGYPADAQYQFLPEFKGGDLGQAAYLRQSLPALDAAGAAEVFVTLRHRDTDRYGSEGLVDFGDPPSYPATRKPAFYVARAWAREWQRRQGIYRDLFSRYGKHAHRLRSLATASARRARRLRKRARAARRRERRYLRLVGRLRVRSRRYDLCFARTGARVCAEDAARASAAAGDAGRRARKAAAAHRRAFSRARRHGRRAQSYRHAANQSELSARGYGLLIKPLL